MSTTDIEHIIQHMTPVSTAAIQQQLEALINDLIQNNFEQLIQLLYRIDVNEKKLKQLLADYPQTDAAALISQLIIERQLQKIQIRKQFKSNDDIADDDKW